MVLLQIYRLLLIIMVSLFFFFAGVGILVSRFAGKSVLARIRAFCTMLWAKSMCRILGIHIKVSGEPGDHSGCFTVCNHISYLDIFVIGSMRPSTFLAKREVRNWPVAGWLSSLAGTVFINRESMKDSLDAIGMIEDRIDCGVNVVLFPEGTTSNGRQINPFKSFLFNLPARRSFDISPISIRYIGINGKAALSCMLDNVAWYGDMDLAPHFWNILGLRSVEASLCFNPVIKSADTCVPLTVARKRLCSLSYESIVSGFAHCGHKQG